MATQRQPIKLVWNAIHQSMNLDSIEQWNVFNHGGFMGDVTQAFKKYENNKDEFLAKVKSSLMYYYWSKCEWEVILSNQNGRMIITPWVGGYNDNISLDVTDAENFDWRGFYNKMTEGYVVERGSVKIDVYDQIMFVWDEFSEYLWHGLKSV